LYSHIGDHEPAPVEVRGCPYRSPRAEMPLRWFHLTGRGCPGRLKSGDYAWGLLSRYWRWWLPVIKSWP